MIIRSYIHQQLIILFIVDTPRFRCWQVGRQVSIGSSGQALRTFPKTVKSQPIDFLWLSPDGNFFFSTFHYHHYIIIIVFAKLDYSTYSPSVRCSFTVGNNPLQQEKAQCDAWTVFGSSMIIQTAIFWQDFGFNYHPQRLKKKKKLDKTVVQSDRNLCQKLFVPNSRLLLVKLRQYRVKRHRSCLHTIFGDELNVDFSSNATTIIL